MLDYLVIGAGLMGAAAFKYLSQTGASTAVVGPREPDSMETFEADPDRVYASHYDQGRVTHFLSRDVVWGQLAKQAISQYANIEAESGIQFHRDVGVIAVTRPDDNAEYLAERRKIMHALGYQPAYYNSPAVIHAAHPMLNFPKSYTGMYEPSPAGYINPRDLIRAQLKIGQANNGRVIRDTVIKLHPHADHVHAVTSEGQLLQAKHVLVAAGAFTNAHNLLPKPLNLEIKGEIILVGRLPKTEAERLAEMPAVLYQVEAERIDDIYLLPPVQYPDGHFYVKLGCNTSADQWFTTLAEMRQWVISGDSDSVAADIQAAVESVIPNLHADLYETRRCLVTYSTHRKPYIDQIDSRLFVATAGNGSSAKCSDAIGMLAADLMIGNQWASPFQRETFKAVFATA